MEVKGMIVDIYKNVTDCSNGGLSSKHNRCLLIGEEIPRIFNGENMPVVTVVKRNINNGTYLTAYPVRGDGNVDRSGMFGGCFIYSSDSRFRKIGKYPIPLHDRKE